MIRRLALLFVVVLLGGVLAACGGSSGGGAAKPSQLNDAGGAGPFDGFGLTPAQPRPTFTLTDLQDKPFDFGSVTTGHPTFLYFGYTHCPDACPQTMANIGITLSKMPAKVAAQTYVVFVTTDVKRDTIAAISQWFAYVPYLTKTKAHVVGLRGTQAQINAAQAAAHITLASDGGETHSTELLLYGPDNYAHVSYELSTNQQQQLIHDLPLVADGKT